jgi:hypothetical protein
MKRTVVIDRQSAPQRLALAVEAVSAGGAVEVEKLLVLRRQGRSLLCCEVIDPTPRSHRCELEYDVLVENASRGRGPADGDCRREGRHGRVWGIRLAMALASPLRFFQLR